MYIFLGSVFPLFSGLKLLGSNFDFLFNVDGDSNLFLSYQQLKQPDPIGRDK